MLNRIIVFSLADVLLTYVNAELAEFHICMNWPEKPFVDI